MHGVTETGGAVLWDVRGVVCGSAGVHIENSGTPCRVAVESDATLILGRDVFINWGADIYVKSRIHIGDYTMIGPRCYMSDHGGHAVTPRETVREGVVTIGSNVWIGHSVHILPGVTIGDGAVIGAGSVVTKPIPSRVTAVGVPARVVRQIDIPDGWIRNAECR